MTPPAMTDTPFHPPLIIIGAGGHARVLLDALRLMNRTVLFATDSDVSRQGQHIDGVPVRDDTAVAQYRPDQVRLVNAVGSIASTKIRRQVYERFAALGYVFESVRHPMSTVSDSAVLGAGVQIMASATIQTGCVIGDNAIINTSASVDHDCHIGAHVHLAPGVTLSGNVRVGAGAHVGTAATIIQGISIGENSTIGAGAVVIRNVEAGSRMVGVPAKSIVRVPLSSTSVSDSSQQAGERFTVMLSAAGRRVSLQRLLRESVQKAGRQAWMLATDITSVGAAFQLADAHEIVPRYSQPGCLEALLSICQKHFVKLIVPTIDPDLPFFARHRDAFASVGTQIMISSPDTIQIANDKVATYQWLRQHGFPTVRQIPAHELLDNKPGWSFPVFVKPRAGSSSIHARVVKSQADLQLALGEDETLVAQDVAQGHEYTIDAYVDSAGHCRCAVPRLRIETRGGEVTKALTVHHPRLEDLAARIAEALPGARGVLNTQIFLDETTGDCTVSEINARFGGGYPLSHAAGATMTDWLVQEALGVTPKIKADCWTKDLLMLRYDACLFLDRQTVGANHPSA